MATLDPWGAVKIDNYSKLFDEFGISRFDDLLGKIPNPHRYMRRHVIFGHRSYETVLEAMLQESLLLPSAASCLRVKRISGIRW